MKLNFKCYKFTPVYFELASESFQQCMEMLTLRLKYAIANSYFFTIFRGSIPPFPPKDGDAYSIPFEG